MKPPMKRVAVTGLGVVSCGGIGKTEFWSTLSQGKSCIRRITRFDTSGMPVKIAGEIQDLRTEDYLAPEVAADLDPVATYAAVATRLALEDSGLDAASLAGGALGICLGSSMGGTETEARSLLGAYLNANGNGHHGNGNGNGHAAGNGRNRLLSIFPGNIAWSVSRALELPATPVSISTGCTASADAIGYGYECIKRGLAERMLVGGSEAPIEALTIQAFDAIGALSHRNDEPTRASRPFDGDRDGFVIAEGSAVLVLEDLEIARSRGAHVYAEVAAYRTTCDAYHLTASDPAMRESSRAVREALKQADVARDEVGCVCAHASSTTMNDARETEIVKTVFGEHAYRLAVTGMKSMIGHTSGAAGAMQAVACSLTLEHELVPPTINYEVSDPGCDLDYVPNQAREVRVDAILQNTYAFSGKNVAIIYKRVDA